MATTFPAFCPRCGLVFQSNLIAVSGNVTGLVLEGNREICPRCQTWAELPDGTFNVVDDTVHVLSATPLTRQRLSQLADIVDALRAGELSESEAAEKAPELQTLFQRYQPLMRRALLTFLWFVLTTLASTHYAESRNHAATRDDVQKAVEAALHQCIQQAP